MQRLSLAAALFMMCCNWYSAAMAQTGEEVSAPQVRVRIFLEAPLGTAVMAPLAVRVATDGPVLQLMSRGAEATAQVEVVIYARNTAADLTMSISIDDAKVATVPSDAITIAAAGGMMRRTAQFTLTAKEGGEAIVFVAVTDGVNHATTSLRIEVAEGGGPSLAVIEPQADTALVWRLLSGETEATTQVQVVIESLDSASTLTMTLFADAAEVVAVPSTPIVIVADGNATRRSASFELTAKTTGTATLRIAVTDGASTATVALRVIVVSASQIAVVEPPAGAVLRLLSHGAEATARVQVVIDTTDSDSKLRMMLSVDATEVVAIPSTPIAIAAAGDMMQRSASFELTAKTTGTATVRIVVTDGASTDTVALRVIVADPQITIKPQVDTAFVLRLPSRGVEVTTQVQVEIETDTTAEFTMALSVDAAEVVTVPSTSIVVVADSDAMRRSASFELTAKTTGTATVRIAVTDGVSTATVALQVIVVIDSQIAIVSPPSGTMLRLLSRGPEATASVQVMIDATDSVSSLTMVLSVDAAGVVAVPSTPIVVVADGDAMRRSASFALIAKEAGTATVMITVTDGVSTATVALGVIVADPRIAIIEPQAGTMLRLLSSGNKARSQQVQVVIETDTTAEFEMAISVDDDKVVAVPSAPIVIAAEGDATRRSAQFELTAKEAGQTTVRIAVTDGASTVRMALSVIVEDPIVVIEPQVGSELQLVRSGPEATTQVSVVIDAIDTAADITMFFLVDDTEVVAIPAASIIIAAEGDATRRSAQFPLTAKETGMATVMITVTDGVTVVKISLKVVVEDPIVVIEPRAGSELQLLGGERAIVPVVIDVVDTAADITMTISVDNAEGVAISTDPIAILAVGNAMRRSAQFELTAKKAGQTTVRIAVTDGVSTSTVRVALIVIVVIAVIEPRADSELQLLIDSLHATTQVPVVIDAVDTAAEITMTVSADNTEVVAISTDPIAILAVGNAMRRSAQFELTAKKAGTTTVTITVTDGVNTVKISLNIVAASFQILSPSDGTRIDLVRGDGSTAATQVEFVIVRANVKVPITLSLQLDKDAGSPVFISTTSLTLTASDDGSIRTRFTVAAAEAGNTMLKFVASDGLGSRVVVSVPVAATRVGELCESCWVPDMVTVPAGTFTMGSPAGEPDRQSNEGPQHPVSIDYALSVGKYELTRGQFRAFVDATGYDAGNGWLEPFFDQDSDAHPVVGVSWNDAWNDPKSYLSWLSEQTGQEWRLLSEAEWEYAARAGTSTTYSFGNTLRTTQARFRSTDGTVVVGSYDANAFGLYDMHGNVWEWVEDCWHGNYNAAPTDGSAWVSRCANNNRVLRGGSWSDTSSSFLRSAIRFRLAPESRILNYGFRVARTLAP